MYGIHFSQLTCQHNNMTAVLDAEESRPGVEEMLCLRQLVLYNRSVKITGIQLTER